jgi:alkyldihydroxyacetonephosphate synthase
VTENLTAVTSELGTKIVSNFNALRARDDLHTRRTYSRDLWPRNLILDREASDVELPAKPSIDVVVWPETLEDLQEIVLFCNQHDYEIYPYGAGSGVCGALTVARSAQVARPRIVVDLKLMDKIEAIDDVSLIVKVQTGVIGQVLEERLNAKGFTLGHFPSSVYCSTLGGYLGTRAAGQFSTYYGKIEDMVMAIEGVLPTGEIFSTPMAPRMAVGVDWNQLMLGSEGTLGLFTSAHLKIHRLPEDRHFLSFHVRSTEAALEGVRIWLQAGLRPAVVRIYDEEESQMLHGMSEGVKLVCVVEGNQAVAKFTAEQMTETAKSFDGFKDTGPEPAEHWWSHRYDISYYQQQVMSHRRVILDTFEVACDWKTLMPLHVAVKAVSQEFKGQGMLVLLAHFSHFYHTGGNIYFTLCGVSPKESPTVDFYDLVWDKLLSACEKQGAAISHHHGIGRLKAAAHIRQRGVFHEVFRKLKHELDPKNILNPSNMGL